MAEILRELMERQVVCSLLPASGTPWPQYSIPRRGGKGNWSICDGFVNAGPNGAAVLGRLGRESVSAAVEGQAISFASRSSWG
jgi:hypothetical protein